MLTTGAFGKALGAKLMVLLKLGPKSLTEIMDGGGVTDGVADVVGAAAGDLGASGFIGAEALLLDGVPAGEEEAVEEEVDPLSGAPGDPSDLGAELDPEAFAFDVLGSGLTSVCILGSDFTSEIVSA
jgi:hypothetical protein